MPVWFRLLCLAFVIAPLPPLAQVPPSAVEIGAYSGLHAAAAKGDTAEIEKLVKAGAPLEARDGHRRRRRERRRTGYRLPRHGQRRDVAASACQRDVYH